MMIQRYYRHIQMLKTLDELDLIEDYATYIVWYAYVHECLQIGEEPLFSNISFPKYVNNHLGYVVEDKKICGKKYRVFRKKPS